MSELTKRRVPMTRQTMQHIVGLMAGCTIDGDFASTILSSMADMLKGSLYSEHGSVDLDDVASTMQDEITAFEEPQHCTACNGSGEGQYDGARCSSCHGKGQHPSPKELAERARHEP